MSIFHITKNELFTEVCPNFVGAMLYAEISNSETSQALKDEIGAFEEELRGQFTIDSIKERSGILATRKTYKAIGKDPSRYRPACEQLARRILQGKGLYFVNTVVDIVNLASLFGGYSTAALNADQIVGKDIELGIGRANEPYEAIGRGVLNIEHLPVYRDEKGGFATPTSDSTRTMMDLDTTHLLMLVNGYDGDKANIEKTVAYTAELLKKYANGCHLEVSYY